MPRVITFQRKRANRRVVNEEQLISLLKEFGEVLTASLSWQNDQNISRVMLSIMHSICDPTVGQGDMGWGLEVAR